MSGWKSGTIACGIVVAVLLGSFLSGKPWWSPASSAREELVAAVGAVRLSEGRLVGGFSHAFGEESGQAEISDELLRVKEKIERNAKGGGSGALGDLAILRLLDRRAEESVLLLEQAVRSAPGDARLWSDLSASYYVRSQIRKQPWDIVLGLAAAEEALALNPDLPEARFNRALGLNKVHLTSRSHRAWIAARDIETNPDWWMEIQGRITGSRQARESELWDRWRSRIRVAALKGQRSTVETITSRFRESARSWIEEDLLAAWAEAKAGGRDADAERDLAVAHIVGEALGSGGDPMVRDAVAAIQRVMSKAEEKQQRYLIEGHKAYGRALRLYPRDVKGTLDGMRDASLLLNQGRSPFAAWAEFWTALCSYQLSSYSEAAAILEELQDSSAVTTYPVLQGRVEWMIGLMAFNRADLFGSVRAYSQALARFARLGEPQNLASVQCRLSLALAALGDMDRAWRLQEQALSALGRFRDPWRVGALLEVSAFQLLRSGQPRVALIFQDEYIKLAMDQDDPVTASAALLQRAETFLSIGRVENAWEDLQQAQEWVERVEDPAVKVQTRGDIAFRKGMVLTRIEPSRAVKFLDYVLRDYLRSDYRILVVQLYMQRAIARLSVREEEGAEADLKAGLAELERVRLGIGSRGLRISYFELARPAFEAMVSYQVSRGKCGLAFDIWERSRARSLAENGGGVGLATVESVRSALPPSKGLIAYAALADELVVWLIRQEGVECRRTPTASKDIARLVHQHRSSILNRSIDKDQAGYHLYEVVLGPIASSMVNLDSLVVVPDRELNRVSFAALRDGHSERYVVESWTISYAPSAALWLRSRSRRSSKTPSSVLVLGDPAFEREAFPTLPRLSEAEKEARDVALLYPIKELWLGEGATREHLLNGLAWAEVVHVAAHALAGSGEVPPSLLLAPEAREEGGALLLEDLSSLGAIQAQVVVLSACGTGEGTVSGMEGTMSLARPFVAAGSPFVVVSLWPVTDRAAKNLLVEFHRGLLSGRSAVEALKQVQLKSLASSESSARLPRNWASFVVVGSD